MNRKTFLSLLCSIPFIGNMFRKSPKMSVTAGAKPFVFRGVANGQEYEKVLQPGETLHFPDGSWLSWNEQFKSWYLNIPA